MNLVLPPTPVEAHAFTVAALTPADMAPLIRGEARDCDGAALALFRRLGLTDRAILAALPHARALARANPRG